VNIIVCTGTKLITEDLLIIILFSKRLKLFSILLQIFAHIHEVFALQCVVCSFFNFLETL